MLHHRKFYVPLYWYLPLLELSYMKKKNRRLYHRGPYLTLVPKARFHVRKPFICPDCKCLSSVKIVK